MGDPARALGLPSSVRTESRSSGTAQGGPPPSTRHPPPATLHPPPSTAAANGITTSIGTKVPNRRIGGQERGRNQRSLISKCREVPFYISHRIPLAQASHLKAPWDR